MKPKLENLWSQIIPGFFPYLMLIPMTFNIVMPYAISSSITMEDFIETYTIHHMTTSWLPKKDQIIRVLFGIVVEPYWFFRSLLTGKV